MYFSHMLVLSFYTIIIINEPNRLGFISFGVTLLGALSPTYFLEFVKKHTK